MNRAYWMVAIRALWRFWKPFDSRTNLCFSMSGIPKGSVGLLLATPFSIIHDMFCELIVLSANKLFSVTSWPLINRLIVINEPNHGCLAGKRE